jgi:hypothetical protein
MLARALAVCAFVVPAVLALSASPVSAHPGDIQLAVDYRTRVTAVTPARSGVEVRFVADGSRLELRNHTGRTVEVAGYQGEPWLQVRTDGVWLNTRSPSQYLDQPNHPQRAAADPRAAPEWQRISGEARARWHDHRTVWHGDPPPQVRSDPSQPHRIRDWTIPLRLDDGTAQITGTLDWLPPPHAGTWWAVVLIATAAIAALGTRNPPEGSRTATALRLGLAAVALVTGLTAIGAAIALVATNVAPTAGGWATGLASEAMPILTGLAMCAAAGAVLARRAPADFGLAFGGIAVAVFSGFVNTAVFSHAVAPVPADGVLARLAETIVLAGGIGLAVAGAVRMFRRPGQPTLAAPQLIAKD